MLYQVHCSSNWDGAAGMCFWVAQSSIPKMKTSVLMLSNIGVIRHIANQNGVFSTVQSLYDIWWLSPSTNNLLWITALEEPVTPSNTEVCYTLRVILYQKTFLWVGTQVHWDDCFVFVTSYESYSKTNFWSAVKNKLVTIVIWRH